MIRALLLLMLFLTGIVEAMAKDRSPPNVQVLHFRSKPQKSNPERTLPTSNIQPINPEIREELFRKIAITSITDEMDELDKNLLVIRALSLTLIELENLYPNIEAGKIRFLTELLQQKI